jgi:hypothetical protein
MLHKKSKKDRGNATRAAVKIEMAEPPIAKSARKKYAKFALQLKRAPLAQEPSSAA